MPSVRPRALIGATTAARAGQSRGRRRYSSSAAHSSAQLGRDVLDDLQLCPVRIATAIGWEPVEVELVAAQPRPAPARPPGSALADATRAQPRSLLEQVHHAAVRRGRERSGRRAAAASRRGPCVESSSTLACARNSISTWRCCTSRYSRALSDRQRRLGGRPPSRTRHLVLVEALLGLRGREADRAEHLPARLERHDHGRAQPQACAASPRAPRPGRSSSIATSGNLADQLRLAACEAPRRGSSLSRSVGVALAAAPRPARACSGRSARPRPCAAHRPRACGRRTSRQPRDHQPRQLAQRVLVVVDRRVQRPLHLRADTRRAVRASARAALVALAREQPLALLLGLAARRDVPQVAGEQRRIGVADRA